MKHSWLTLSLCLLPLLGPVPSLTAAPEPIAPVGANGDVLNLDFETGNLQGWTAEGNAFAKQPVQGDRVNKRRSDMKSEHQGQFWVGTFENGGDDATGTLTSVPFVVKESFAAFLVAGGSGPKTRVELWDPGAKEPFFKVAGEDSENLRPAVVELKGRVGRQIYIRLVDQETGGWGHLNFDNFKFYAEKPEFPNAIDVKKQNPASADDVLFAGLSPEDAAAKTTVPPGFKTTLFAGEPDVMQPIAFAIDHRGRLWVAEAYTYPIRAEEGKGRDRIVVFEDTDGDGKFNRRTVFIEGLNLVSGLEFGFGGVYVGAAPYLMFIPIADGDEPKPVGKPEILLDGWAYQDTHETLNTLTWGPDGWLYGCHGVFTHSNVGKPGAPDSERTRINAGVWRFHPVKKTFEVFAEGTSNPWGIDFDEHGQLFSEACVIPHLFHLIQGGRFTRQAGAHFNPFIYDDIKTIADHVHYAGNKGPHAGNGRSDAAGGGHAHAGLMIYQGENWPAEYRGKIFIGNIHGQRINMDVPVASGSGFIGQHAPDPINFNDKWSQVINFKAGPDGSVYFIDWYDKNQCHHNDANGHDRSNGRIYRISYGDPKFAPVDLTQKSEDELVKLLPSKNNWLAEHAQRVLQERAATATKSNPTLTAKLYTQVRKGPASPQRLRALWTLHTTTGLSGLKAPLEFLRSGSKYPDAYVRAWAIQLGLEFVQQTPGDWTTSPHKKKFVSELTRLAHEDASPVVRLYIASALQRLPAEVRWETVAALASHGEDAGDHNLPLMVWYAGEPLATVDAKRALELAEQAELPNLLNFTVRRTAAIGTPEAMAAIVQSLQRVATNSGKTLDALNGLSLALKGQRTVKMPAGWEDVETLLSNSPNTDIKAQVQALSLTFGSKNALASLKATLANRAADLNARRTALDSLLAAKDASLPPVLQDLLAEPGLRDAALRGLAAYDDAQTPARILVVYPQLAVAEKRDALNTLVSRSAFARPLVAAVAAGTVPRADLTAEIVRQLRSFKDEALKAELEKVYGVLREASADKKALIEKYKKIYYAGGSQPGDASRGRAVFGRTCLQCHTLFDAGGKVGPDLTGSNRGDLDYILENMLDPNAVIPNDYRAWTLETKDDRVITGVVKSQDDKAVTIVAPNETLTIPRGEILSLQQNQLSMMPEGLLEPLTEQEVRDLIYYLSRPGQVPLPVEK